MSHPNTKGGVVTASLLISATCVGTFFLSAMPIVTGMAGYLPSLIASIVVWLTSLSLGLLYAEATLGHPDGANITTITRSLLGKTMMWITVPIFLISIFVLLSSYFIVGFPYLNWALEHYLHIELPFYLFSILIALLAGTLLSLGRLFASRITAILFMGSICALFLTVIQGADNIESKRLARQNWTQILFAIPLLFSAYGYTAIIPTICSHLNQHRRKVQSAIIIGTTLPLLIYLIWNGTIIGTLPQGYLWIAYEKGLDLTHAILWDKHLTHLINFILFFTSITSLLAVGLALIDVYSDMFGIAPEKRRGGKRLVLCLLIFIPPLIFANLWPQFIPKLIELVIAPIGRVFIGAILPIWLVAKARYTLRLPTRPLFPGGKPLLIILGIAVYFLIYVEGVRLLR